MKDEYIRKQDAIDAISIDGINCHEELVDIWTIEHIPAADVVEAVRCRDCKHVCCRIYHGWQEPIYTCTHLRSRWNTDNDLEVNPDDFCSYGKRREE